MEWRNKLIGRKETPFIIPEGFEGWEKFNPEKPINFGRKTIWSAIKSDSCSKVAKFLNIGESNKCNWVEGTIRAYNGDVFILPSIENWVIIHGWGLPIPNTHTDMRFADNFLNYLSNEFGEAQLFGNHRVSSSAFWMKATNGKLDRAYIVGDGEGGMIGNPTTIEEKMNLIDFSSPEINNEEYYKNRTYPGEDEVFEVAENWSINPQKLESIPNIGNEGYYGRIKNEN